MKIIIKKVYYCEFCKKKGLSSGHMHSHEKHCTANPKRDCRMCKTNGSMTIMLKLLNSIKTIDTVREVSVYGDECPACVLAFMRQKGIHNVKIRDTNDFWNYKDSVNKWWKVKNEENEEI